MKDQNTSDQPKGNISKQTQNAKPKPAALDHEKFNEAVNWPITDFFDLIADQMDAARKKIILQKFKENFFLRTHFLDCELFFEENNITSKDDWHAFLKTGLKEHSITVSKMTASYEKKSTLEKYEWQVRLGMCSAPGVLTSKHKI